MTNRTLELERVSEAQLMALAQMLIRMYFEDMRRLAVDDAKTNLMASAVEKLQTALDRAGYNPDDQTAGLPTDQRSTRQAIGETGASAGPHGRAVRRSIAGAVAKELTDAAQQAG